ncbi:MAG: ATP-binding protein [Thermodesulfobacteriota bacterium]|nr:ATP-binding protein [Thermodesulfobacteriota bacterium]
MELLKECPKSRKLIDEILSSIQAAVVLADVQGQILFANSAVKRVFGFTAAELQGKKFSVFFTPEDLKCLYPNLLYMARKKDPFEGELMLKRKNGSRFFAFWVSRVRVDLVEGKSLMVICIQDVDDLKQREKRLRETNYGDLLRIADGIAHELRNPVVGIAGFVNKLYKSCRAAPDHDKYYNYITDNLKKIEALVKEVEFLAHLPHPCFVDKSIKDVIETASISYHEEMKARDIDFSLSMEDARLYVDPDLVTQVFSIVIQNAIDATNSGGRISVQSETRGNQCSIYVTDTGRGIAPGDIPHIFDPFFSTKTDGAGINLAVAKRIMDIHGGKVEATSQPGKGTTLLLVFALERRREIRVSLLDGKASFNSS